MNQVHILPPIIIKKMSVWLLCTNWLYHWNSTEIFLKIKI
jgi:hypothetical protein